MQYAAFHIVAAARLHPQLANVLSFLAMYNSAHLTISTFYYNHSAQNSKIPNIVIALLIGIAIGCAMAIFIITQETNSTKFLLTFALCLRQTIVPTLIWYLYIIQKINTNTQIDTQINTQINTQNPTNDPSNDVIINLPLAFAATNSSHDHY